MKAYLAVVGVLILTLVFALTWFGFIFRPWMPEGSTVHLGDWKFGECQFQVWQSKNKQKLEPFATALFVRCQTNQQWLAFSLGHQDGYLPAIRLTQTNTGIAVFHGRKLLGTFDTIAANYYRCGQIKSVYEGTTDSPEHWWVYWPKSENSQ